jgi:hypothetical protein
MKNNTFFGNDEAGDDKLTYDSEKTFCDSGRLGVKLGRDLVWPALICQLA